MVVFSQTVDFCYSSSSEDVLNIFFLRPTRFHARALLLSLCQLGFLPVVARCDVVTCWLQAAGRRKRSDLVVTSLLCLLNVHLARLGADLTFGVSDAECVAGVAFFWARGLH